jgi:cell division protein ZapE
MTEILSPCFRPARAKVKPNRVNKLFTLGYDPWRDRSVLMADGPLPAFRALVAEGKLSDDPAGRLAAEKLQLLHTRLKGYDPARPRKVGIGVFGWGRETLRQAAIPGIYIHGGVGRGKTMLMDLFYVSAPVQPKRRVHYHAFMQEVHARIAAARKNRVKDPVSLVGDQLAHEAVLLCLDEMQITDITDAMLVGRLFERLFDRGTVLVVTSNRHPDELYKDGLNRALFLPFIALIKDRLELHHLDSPTDHRLGRAASEKVWHAPVGTAADSALNAAWSHLAGGKGSPLEMSVQGRKVTIPQFRNGIGRADFEDLCETPLGAADYLALTGRVNVLILDRIPVLSGEDANAAKRFVTLIDTLYEGRVRLIASAEAEPGALYPEGAGAFEFQRTVSRLEEMRTASWPGGQLDGAASEAPATSPLAQTQPS